MQINVSVQDANNIVCNVVPPQTQTITIDRGVAGNGIVSIVPVTISTLQYLRITYTNGTVVDVGPLTSTAYTGTAPITIVGNTISLATVPVASGGTGITSLTAGYIPFGNGTSAFGSSSNLFWDSANSRLGVGTSSPAAKLQVKVGTDQNLHVSSGSSVLGLFAVNDAVSAPVSMQIQGSDLRFNTGSPSATEKMRLDSSGNLGLGVTPSANSLSGSGYRGLEVGTTVGTGLYGGGNELYSQVNTYYNSGFKYATTAAATQYLQSAGIHKWYNAPSGTAGNAITFTQAMTLNSSGNLIVGGTSFAYATSNRNNIAVNGTSTAFYELQTGGVGRGYLAAGATNIELAAVGYTVFTTNGSERMRLDSSGFLGLGVTPSSWGTSWRAFDFNNRGGLACGFDETDLNNNVYRINTGAYYYKETAAATTYNQSGGGHYWYNAPSGTAGTVISFTQAMTLDTSGNLGLGVTPSAWSSGFKVLQAGSTAAIAGGNNSAYLATNWYQDSGSTNKYLTTASAGLAGWEGNVFKWYQTASGTAGTAITFTQAMTLNASGNLGVGTTSPSYKLDVVGDGRFGNGTASTFLLANGSSSGTNGGATISVQNAGSTIVAIGNYSNLIGGAYDSTATVYSSTALRFYIGSAVQATLSTSGNLGLGVTPSAWSGYAALQTAGGSMWGSANLGILSTNVYYNAGYKYASTNYAEMYQQSSGSHAWYTAPSGTAGNAITFTQAMTLTAVGNLGIGTTSPGTTLHISTDGTYDPLRLQSTQSGNARSWTLGPNVGTAGVFAIRDSTAGANRLEIDTSGNLGLGVTPSAWVAGSKALQVGSAFGLRSTTSAGYEMYSNAYNNGTNDIYIATNYAAKYQTYNGQHLFFTAASGTAGNAITFTQAMTLDSAGRLLVAKTSSSSGSAGCELQTGAGGNAAAVFVADGAQTIITNRLTSDGTSIEMRRSGSTVGSISVTTTATAYNTSSDYRLKNTIAPMTGALAKVALLKPCTYKWNVDGSDGEGFIAHELAEVCPQAVVGEKDAVDADGSPKYQGIDTSFLVATLTAALQELNAKFDAYVASHP